MVEICGGHRKYRRPVSVVPTAVPLLPSLPQASCTASYTVLPLGRRTFASFILEADTLVRKARTYDPISFVSQPGAGKAAIVSRRWVDEGQGWWMDMGYGVLYWEFNDEQYQLATL